MGQGTQDDYCSFTKAVEHLGDRWSFLIVRELVMAGPQGFNALAAGLPGHVSRSVLTDKLHKLEVLGLIFREARTGRTAPYRLTPAGEALVPTLLSLRDWAEAWMPDDPAMVERDPEIIWGWLAKRIDPAQLPDRQASSRSRCEVRTNVTHGSCCRRASQPYGCLEDPLLDESRYVYVEAGLAVLLSLARGHQRWRDAIAGRSVHVFGDPALVAALPGWFVDDRSTVRADTRLQVERRCARTRLTTSPCRLRPQPSAGASSWLRLSDGASLTAGAADHQRRSGHRLLSRCTFRPHGRPERYRPQPAGEDDPDAREGGW